jgi:hypothetical protein
MKMNVIGVLEARTVKCEELVRIRHYIHFTFLMEVVIYAPLNGGQPMQRALNATSQTLAITSQLLMIGIELGILAGGFYLVQKLSDGLSSEQPEEALAVVSKPTKKSKFRKVKKIISAIIE